MLTLVRPYLSRARKLEGKGTSKDDLTISKHGVTMLAAPMAKLKMSAEEAAAAKLRRDVVIERGSNAVLKHKIRLQKKETAHRVIG